MSQDGPLYSGSLVALDGLPEAALETQLRLLPASSQILVLPSLQQYLGKDDGRVAPFALSSSALSKLALSTSVAPSKSRPSKPSTTAPFDARRYIKSIHDAAAARRAIALEFLQNNDAANTTRKTTPRTPPRKIVFLNGGTATSHALCIEAIRQHDAAAGGNLEQAALLFDQLTAHGVAGLDGTMSPMAAAETSRLDDIAVDDDDDDKDDEESGNSDDPITKAMRAADALDRKTEGLQPSTHILDLTITKKPRPRSLSLPIHGDLLDLWDAGRRPSQVPTANTNNPTHNNGNDDTSTINNRSFYWVPPSMAAGAAGSEIYDVNNFSFISPASPSRGGSPTSTIFPVSMRLDAIASQQQRRQQKKTPSTSPARQFVSYRSATTGETMRTVVLGPAPRGRTVHRRPSRVDTVRNNDEEDDDDKPFYLYRHQPQQRRARSLERKPSIGAGSFSGFSGISSISGVSGFSGFSGNSSGNGLGMNMNFFLSTSSREPSSTRPRRTSNVSDDAASLSTSAFGGKPSLSSSTSSKIMLGGTSIPDVPLLPAAEALEKMALSKKMKTKLKTAATTTATVSVSQKKPQLRLKTPRSTTEASSSSMRYYVDRGTDAEQESVNSSGTHAAFEPVLPLVEDLVIRFDDDGTNVSNPTLELAIQRCRELDGAQIVHHRGSALHETVLPKQMAKGHQPSFDQKTMSSALPETPKSSSHGHSSSSSSAASASLLLGATATATAAAAQAASTFSTDDYDPFAPHEYNTGPKLPLPIAVPIAMQPQAAPSIKTPQPLTPAHTPPPQQRLDGDADQQLHDGSRFHVLATARFQTALALHNGLRSVLDAHFSEEHESVEKKASLDSLTSDSPTSFIFSCLPGMEGNDLWAPLLAGNRTGVKEEVKTAAETPVTNMVLAVGSHRGVPSSLLAKITGQLDALSNQPATSISRGGRLDIRYLIANAMQTLAAQQVRNHDMGTGTDVLATLVIAQLDLYLRTHPSSSLPASSSVRLVLLDYPLELLPVVLVIQQLTGREMVQVSSVIAVENSTYRGESRRPGFQMLQQAPISPKLKFSPPVILDVNPKQPPFKRVNFLLTSAASETDVEAFVSSVRKILVSGMRSVPTKTATSPAEVAFQNGMIPLTLVAQQQGDMGRYSALSTATTAAGGAGTGISSSGSSRNSKIRTPPRTNNLMQSPTLPSPLLGNTPSPRRRASSSEKEKKRAVADSSNNGTAPRPPPLPFLINTRKSAPSKVSTAPSISTVRPPKSPAPSTLSQQSQASSLQSFQSQADSWRTTAKTPSYMAQATGLAPAPIVLPSGRLVAKTIQVSGPTAVRRANEQTAVAVNPGAVSGSVILNNLVAASMVSTSSVRSDNDDLSNWDAGLDVSEDGNYAYDDPPFGSGNSNATGATNGNGVANSINNVNTSSVVFGGYNDDDYDYGEDDDDFENDLDMRRLMPLFMRDRAALLAAKEAAGSRGVRPPPMRSKSSQLTGASMRAASASAAMPPAQAPLQAMAGGGLRGKASFSSIHSQHSHGSSLANKNSNEGKKALKWLGLA